ncbi:hypothetical protein [Halovenus sp. HT40]|uniref:hypothetical protein n=1 Tax=Halovenus sp. HT40 TaxID=3126691 RepID=UPI00300EB81C
MKQPPSDTREESPGDSGSDPTQPRIAGALLVVTGLVHLVAPTTLLGLAERSYRLVLSVDFEPRQGASTRVRALGLGLVAAGAHLLYYGGLLPSDK